jgi:hypothetical protein
VQKPAERRRARSVDHTGLEVGEHCAGQVFAALSLVIKHVDVAELRVVVTTVPAVAANAVLLSHLFSNFLPIWLLHWPACMSAISHKEAAWRRGERGRKGRGEAGKSKINRVEVRHGKQEIPAARARISRKRERSGFAIPAF